jgi:hypothetical protein
LSLAKARRRKEKIETTKAPRTSTNPAAGEKLPVLRVADHAGNCDGDELLAAPSSEDAGRSLDRSGDHVGAL